VELLPGFQDDCWFSTGHFADVMMGFGHDAEASSYHAFYGAQCSFLYRTSESLIVTLGNQWRMNVLMYVCVYNIYVCYVYIYM
jgi:hypothetical protein